MPKAQNSSSDESTATSAPVSHRKVKITRSGETSTARCSCGWTLTADPRTVGSAAAVHAGESRRSSE